MKRSHAESLVPVCPGRRVGSGGFQRILRVDRMLWRVDGNEDGGET